MVTADPSVAKQPQTSADLAFQTRPHNEIKLEIIDLVSGPGIEIKDIAEIRVTVTHE